MEATPGFPDNSNKMVGRGVNYQPPPPTNKNQLFDRQLHNLLIEWGLEETYEDFKRYSVDIETLPYLLEKDLEKIFPYNLKYLSIARYKLLNWQKANSHLLYQNLNCNSPASVDSDISILSVEGASCASRHAPTPAFTPTATPTPTPTPAPMKGFNIFEYQKSLQGNSLCKAYEENDNRLTEKLRETLVDDIVRTYTTNHLIMKDNDYFRIRDELATFFEKERKEYYFDINEKGRVGKLYHKYKNSVSNLRRKGLFPKENKRRKLNDPLALPCVDDHPFSTEFEAERVWLSNYTETYSTVDQKWSTVQRKWKETSSLRLKGFRESNQSLTTILEDWPAYNCSYGHRLIDIDFETCFGHPCGLAAGWEEFTKKIGIIFDQKTVDNINVALVYNDNNNQRDIAILEALHHILTPTGKTKGKDKRIWKYSISDSQTAMVQTVKTKTAVDTVVMQRKLKYSKFPNLKCQTYILIVDSDPLAIYTVYDDIKYKFNNFIHALSCAYKIMYVFDLKYQEECKYVWQFLQSYFYKNETGIAPNVSGLLSTLGVEINEK